ncbi:hypothetical protein GALMADRAFT_56376 [Galerina marginata CBS 339.88]|uniref:Uncharacterized protein n=1 Tax=Galerina marginata (strain CBS 339.88) TaxID=685588 RepID=A0A067TNY4_GALM3|nr:hypothetical protein GALMADRAFT_56376 [Galerina marginata CBS 339.88]
MSTPELACYSTLKSWLDDCAGGFHPNTRFNEDHSGSHIVTTDDLEKDFTVVSCPFRLVISQALAKRAVMNILGGLEDLKNVQWSERQWICTYISLHWIVGPEENMDYLAHFEYINTLPTAEKLRTPLHFFASELQLFKGTNIYGATGDRERDWKFEWNQCCSVVRQSNHLWGELFTWLVYLEYYFLHWCSYNQRDKYLTSATYLSSRAFPSSLLADTPSLVRTPSTEPVLIPGVDSLNHARGQPVSWFVTYPTSTVATSCQEPKISLVLHSSAVKGQELFNNYGPKPNSELILGYGFSIPNNPDDTIVLKVGGIGGNRWEIGRGAENIEGMWKEILSALLDSEKSMPTYEDILDASGMLQDMVETLIERLPAEQASNPAEVRPEVFVMFLHYLEGQRDILQSIVEFAKAREQEAVEMARHDGIDVVLED